MTPCLTTLPQVCHEEAKSLRGYMPDIDEALNWTKDILELCSARQARLIYQLVMVPSFKNSSR